jgi:MscS family membrane protein
MAKAPSQQDPAATLVEQATQSVSETAKTVQESTQAILPSGLQQGKHGVIDYAQVGIALGAISLALLLRWLVLVLLAKFAALVRRSGHELDQKLLGLTRRAASYVLVLAGLFVALSSLYLPAHPTDWHTLAWRGYLTLAIAASALLLYNVIDTLLTFAAGSKRSHAALFDRQILPLFRDILKVVLLVLAVAALVQNWGYDATTLLAGVGIGGLAVAFAAQDTIANVFGSLVIYTDRPFRVGDWVEIGDVEGTVEEIGIRSTRIRCFDRSIISVPNKSVSGTYIQNNSAMTSRRIQLALIAVYSTPADTLSQALAAVRELIAADDQISADGVAVSLERFGPAGIHILIQCFTHSVHWLEYLKVREDLMLGILQRLELLGVSLADQQFISAPRSSGSNDKGSL